MDEFSSQGQLVEGLSSWFRTDNSRRKFSPGSLGVGPDGVMGTAIAFSDSDSFAKVPDNLFVAAVDVEGVVPSCV